MKLVTRYVARNRMLATIIFYGNPDISKKWAALQTKGRHTFPTKDFKIFFLCELLSLTDASLNVHRHTNCPG